METVLLRYDSTSSHMVIPPSDYQVTSHQTQPAIKKKQPHDKEPSAEAETKSP
jgi:hypothetical protein